VDLRLDHDRRGVFTGGRESGAHGRGGGEPAGHHAPAAGVARLDDHRIAEPLGGLDRARLAPHLLTRHRQAEVGEDAAGLLLVPR
jgi:hypothetical protein